MAGVCERSWLFLLYTTRYPECSGRGSEGIEKQLRITKSTKRKKQLPVKNCLYFLKAIIP